MDFEDKQAQVLAKGMAKRGEYSPRPGSAPLRAYNYWLREGWSEAPVRENFCHYWRVVVLWAPLTWLFLNVLEPFFTNRLFEAEWNGLVKVTGGFGRFVGRTVNRVPKSTWSKIGEWSFKVFLGLAGLAFAALLLAVASTNWLAALGIVLLAVVFGAVLITLTYFIGSALDKRQKARDEARAILLEKYYNGELDEYPSSHKVKRPGPIKRFFKGVGEFLVLGVQIVRVNKWKICPIVEIPE